VARRLLLPGRGAARLAGQLRPLLERSARRRAVTSADPNTGLIRGTRGGIDVTVVVARQADGSVRVQFDSKGQTQQDPGLAERFSQAYERRMGR